MKKLKLGPIGALAFKANTASVHLIEKLKFKSLGPIVIEAETVGKYQIG